MPNDAKKSILTGLRPKFWW